MLFFLNEHHQKSVGLRKKMLPIALLSQKSNILGNISCVEILVSAQISYTSVVLQAHILNA